MAYRLCPPRPDGEKDEDYYAAIADQIRDIVHMDGLPCCIPVHLSCYWSGPDDVQPILDALGDDFPVEVLLPGAFAQLAAKAYRDRLLMTVPRQVQVIPGLWRRLPISLQSTWDAPTAGTLTASCEGGEVTPASQTVTVAPGEDARADVRMRLPEGIAGGAATITLESAGGILLEQMVRAATVPAPSAIPDGEFQLQSVWEAEAVSHGNGHAVDEGSALNKKAWATVEGTDPPTGTTIWGQYEPLEPGRYAVAFRCRTAPGATGMLARLDAFDFGSTIQGGTGALGGRALGGEDLPADGSYADIWLTFEVTNPGKVEYRVIWTGKGTLVTDRIVVLKRTGDAP